MIFKAAFSGYKVKNMFTLNRVRNIGSQRLGAFCSRHITPIAIHIKDTDVYLAFKYRYNARGVRVFTLK